MIDRIEFPLDLDRPRGRLGGLSLRQLADMPFAELSQWSTAGWDEPARGEIVFWRERDPLWQAARTWALMQTREQVGCHLFGAGDELFVSVLRYWCEQSDVLVSTTFDARWVGAFEGGAGILYGRLKDVLLDGRLGNSVAAGDLTSTLMGSAGRSDPLLARWQPEITDRGGTTFVSTPPPGTLAELAEREDAHPSTRVVSPQPALVIDRRLLLFEADGMIQVSERGRLAREAATGLELDHRAAVERATAAGVTVADGGYKAAWRQEAEG